VAALQAVADDERVEFVQEEFEEKLWSDDKSRAQETDKAWDAIHRSLTDGTLGWESGEYPLNHTIFGGESLYDGDDYIGASRRRSFVLGMTASTPMPTGCH
jgi:hypothetical protein